MTHDNDTDNGHESTESADYEAGAAITLLSDAELADLAAAEESEFASVTYEIPSVTNERGYASDHGWTVTGAFLNTEVPMVLVARKSRVLKIPLSRVISIDRLPDPRDDDEERDTLADIERAASETEDRSL